MTERKGREGVDGWQWVVERGEEEVEEEEKKLVRSAFYLLRGTGSDYQRT